MSEAPDSHAGAKAVLRDMLVFLLQWTTILTPGIVALYRISADSVWRDDMAVVRGLQVVSLGGPSSLSTLLMQASSLLPIGTLSFRMGIASAVGLSLCAALLQILTTRVLTLHVSDAPLLNRLLATVATLTVTLAPALQAEGTAGGGAVMALAAALAVFTMLFHGPSQGLRWYLLASVMYGALLAESVLTGLVIVPSIAVALWGLRPQGSRRALLWLLAFAIIPAVFLHLPAVIRPHAPNVAIHFGHGFELASLVPIDPEARVTGALGAWKGEVGLISLVVALLGLGVGLWRKRVRWVVLPLALAVVADAVFPATKGSVLFTDLLVPLRAVAVAAISVIAALGVQAIVTTLLDTRLVLGRAAAVLVVLFNVTLIGITSEQATFSVDRSQWWGASAYADEAFEKLPSNAVVLARSHAVMWRLLAARTLTGARPDVIVVPFPLIAKGSVASQILEDEPAASLLLRDMILQGTPTAHAIARVADQRALYAEFDPSWPAELATQMKADGLWILLKPHPLGRSDRREGITQSAKIIRRLVADARACDVPDRATESVLLSLARQQTVAAALANDLQTARDSLGVLEELAPEDRFVRMVRQRLLHSVETVDVGGLLGDVDTAVVQ